MNTDNPLENPDGQTAPAIAEPSSINSNQIAANATRTNLFRRHPLLTIWLGLTLLSAVGSALNAQPKHQMNVFWSSLVASGVGWGCVIGVIFLIAAGRRTAKEREAENARLAVEAERRRRKQMHDFLRMPMEPIVAGNLVLKQSEQFYWQGEATLYTMHKYRHYVGGSSGASFRVARGFYLRGGDFRGAPVTTQNMESDGTGSIYLTNKRFLFVWKMKSVEIPFFKIASTELYSDGIRIDVVNKTPVILVTGDMWLGMYYHRLKEGLIDAVPDSAIPESMK